MYSELQIMNSEIEECPRQSKNFKIYLGVWFTLDGKKRVKTFTGKIYYMNFQKLVFSIYENSFFQSIEQLYMSNALPGTLQTSKMALRR